MTCVRTFYACLLALLFGVDAIEADWSYKTTQDGQFKLGRDGPNLSVEFRSIIATFRVPEDWQISSCVDEPMDFIFAAGPSPNGLSLAFTIDENARHLSLPRQYSSHLKHIQTVYDDKVRMSAETPFQLRDGRRLTPHRYFSDYWGQRLVLLIPEDEYTCQFEFTARRSLSDLRESHAAIQRLLDSYRCSHKTDLPNR